jgi:hypothetical protein
MVQEARGMADAIEADPQALDAEPGKVAKQLTNLLNLAAESSDKAILDRNRQTDARAAELGSASPLGWKVAFACVNMIGLV